MADTAKIDVLFIAGVRRSGSTVLGNLLGEIPGCFQAGEVAILWLLLANDGVCGCGMAFRQCPTWRKIFTAMEWEPEHEVADAMAQKLGRGFAGKWLPFLLAVPLLKRMIVPKDLRPSGELADLLRRLYVAIAEVTNASVIVDSSKSPAYAYLLAQQPRLNVKIIHLVRNPLSNVLATLTRPDDRLPHVRRFENLITRSLAWAAWHFSVSLLWGSNPGSYLHVRYEDFTADPEGELRRITAFAGSEHVPLVIDRTISMSGNHSVLGNPRQVRIGNVEIQSSSQTAPPASPSRRLVIGLLTGPARRRYWTSAKGTNRRARHAPDAVVCQPAAVA